MASALHDARERQGWTQEQTATKILKLAASRDVRLSVNLASLKQMISDMERGKRKPGLYLPLLCDLFGRTAEELGFGSAPAPIQELPAFELGEMLSRAAAVDAAAVMAFQQQVDCLRTLDRQLGSPAVVEPTAQLVNTMQDLMVHLVGDGTRAALAAVLSDAAALNGWQVLNTGDIGRAWRLHELARSAGREAGKVDLLAHAMGEQTYDLLDIDRPADALQLVQAARQVAGTNVPPRLRAWLHAAEAEAHARVGDASSCLVSLDRAALELPDDADGSETPYISLDEWHMNRWRGNILTKLGDSAALESQLVALDSTPPAFVRAKASLHCDIAHSYAVRGEQMPSLQHARQARELARRTGSVRQLRRIEVVTKMLA